MIPRSTALFLGSVLLLLAAPAPGLGSLVQSPATFLPDVSLSPPGGPTVHVFSTGTSDAVALRVSVPLRETSEIAGAGQILGALAESRMRSVGSRIGARVRVNRTPDALVYEVAGPEADLDFLAWVLREGLSEPDADRLPQLRRDARIAVERRLETPEGTMALRLRRALSPSTPPLYGSVPAIERLTPDALRAIWHRSHRRENLRVLAVGNVAPETLLASLAELGLPSDTPASPPVVGAPAEPPVPTPELVRHWIGLAWPIGGPREARTLVATRLIAETLRSDPGDYEVGVELWEVDGGWVLVLSGSAYPRSRQDMLARVEGLLAETTAAITPESVRRHVAGVRAELLDSARTPWGLADVVGHALDAGESLDRVQALVDELDRVEPTDVIELLQTLRERAPVSEVMDP